MLHYKYSNFVLIELQEKVHKKTQPPKYPSYYIYII